MDGHHEQGAAEASVPPPPGASAPSLAAGLDTSERLLAAGAGLYLVCYAIFHLGLAVLWLWYPFMLLLTTGVVAAIVARHRQPDAVWLVPYDLVLRVLAYSAGGFAVLEFLSNARFGSLDEPQYVVGQLVLLAGPVLMVAGAKQRASSGS